MRRLGIRRLLHLLSRVRQTPPVPPLILRRRAKGLSWDEYVALQRVSLAADVQLFDGSLSLEEYVRMSHQTAHITRILYHHLGASTLSEHLLDADTQKVETPV